MRASDLREDLGATLATVARDARLHVGLRRRLVTQALSIAFQLVVFSFIGQLVDAERFGTGSYVGFVAVGLAGLGFVAAVLAPATTIREQRLAETLERTAATGFGVARGAAAMLVFPWLNACASGALLVGAAGIAFGAPVDALGALAALALTPLVGLALAPIGLLFAAVALAWRGGVLGTTPVVALLSLTAGAYFPVDLLPGALGWVADVQPVRPALDLLRRLSLDGTPGVLGGSVLEDVVRLAGFAAVGLPVGALALRLAEARARRAGTLREL